MRRTQVAADYLRVRRPDREWLRTRMLRALPGPVPRPLKVLVIIIWAAVLAEGALVLFFPSDPQLSWQIAGTFTAIVAAAGVVSALAAVTRLLRTQLRYAALLGLLASSVLPLAVLSLASWEPAVGVGILSLAALVGVQLLPVSKSRATTQPSRQLRLAWMAAGLAGSPWLLAFCAMAWAWAHEIPESGEMFSQLLVGTAALALFAYAIGACVAVSEAVPRRQARLLRPLRRVTLRALVLLLIAKAVYLTVRLTVAPDLFGDSLLWDIRGRSTVSWLHAVLLVTLILAVVWRSSRTPLSRSGLGSAVPVVTAVVALGPVLDLADATVTWGWITADPTAVGEANALLFAGAGPFGFVVQDLMLVAALAVGIAGLARWARRGWDAGAFLLVLGCLNMAPLLWNSLQRHPPGMALPTQVDLVATVAVVGLLLTREFGRRLPTRPPVSLLPVSALARVAVTTFLAVHAVALLPQVVEEHLAQELAVLALLLVAIGLPAASADPERRVRTLLIVLGGGLATMTAFLLMLVTGDAGLVDGLQEFTILALLLLPVPLAGLYAARMRVPTPMSRERSGTRRPEDRTTSGPTQTGPLETT